MSKYWSQLWCLKGVGYFQYKVQGEGGHPTTTFGLRKLESLGYHVALFGDPAFNHFDIIPACYTQTNTRSWLLPAHRLCRACKNAGVQGYGCGSG